MGIGTLRRHYEDKPAQPSEPEQAVSQDVRDKKKEDKKKGKS
jgi:hypothetical protein